MAANPGELKRWSWVCWSSESNAFEEVILGLLEQQNQDNLSTKEVILGEQNFRAY